MKKYSANPESLLESVRVLLENWKDIEDNIQLLSFRMVLFDGN